MGLWSRFKRWVSRTFGGNDGSSRTTTRASRVSNYGGGGIRSYRDYSGGGYEHEYQSYQRRRELERQERKRKQDATTNALASISKRTDSLSSGRSPSVANNGTTRVLAKIGQKATPPDPKEKARQTSQQRATAQLKKISDNRKSYNKATNDRYNVDKNGLKARQAQKSQAYDVEAEKWETKQHPVATSFARGAASGVTFGGSELLAQKSKNRQKSGAEQFYQQNKNRKAEVAGEIAGSLVGFGLTGEASAKAVGKLTPKAVKSLGARGTEKLASSAMIRRAAEKEAVKRFGVEGATKEVINQIARRRAATAMAELGKDAAINMTTGLASDLSHSYLDASKDGTFDRGEFAKSMGQYAALNTLLGGATSLVPAFRVGKHFDDGIDALKSVNASNVADDVKVSLNRRRRTDVRMPEVRPQTLDEAIERAATDTVERNADEAVRQSDVVLGSGKRTYTFEVYNTDGRREIVTVKANKASEASNIAGEYGASKGLMWSNNITKRAKATPPAVENVADNVRRADEAFEFPDAETYIRELDERGEQWLGQHGHITANEDGTYNLFVNGVGDRTLTRDEAVDYITRARDALQEEEIARAERERVTRTTPLNEAENARIAEIDNEVERLRQEGLDDANQLKANKYKGINDYDTRQAERAKAERKLSKEKDTIIRKEPPVADEFPYEGTAEADDMARRIKEGKSEKPTPPERYKAIREEERKRGLGTGKIKETPPTKANDPSQFAQTDDGMFATIDEDIPSNDVETIRQNDTKQNLEAEAERMSNEKPKEEADDIKVNNVADDKGLSNRLPKDVNKARSIYEWNTGEKVEGGVRTSWDEAWNAAKEYAQSQGSGMRNRKSKVSVSQINAMDSDAERELRQKLADEGLLNYDVVHTDELYDKVSKQMRDDPDRWVKEMIDINEGGALDFRATPEWQARVQYIMATVDPSADSASEIAYTEAFKLAKDISSKGGQTLNLRKNFVHLTEAGKRDSAVEDLAKILYKSKVFAKNHAKELNGKGYFDRINYIKGVLMENDKIKDGVERLVKAENPDAVSNAYAELMLQFNKENPKSGFDIVQEIRYLNMLGNPKTHIRNLFGSGMFSPVRQVSNAIRAGIENRYATKTGLEITKHGGMSLQAFKEARTKNPTSEAGKKALEAFSNLKTDILGSAKYDTQSYTGRSKTALGKALDFLSDKNSAALAKEDDFFKERAFRENYIKSYNKYAKNAPITPKIERKIEAEALQEAQIATFNEFNELANFLGKISSKAYDVNASPLERGGGMLMNALMPFTKVPANIMKQSINYSPVGIARGLSNIKKAGQTGNAELLNKAIDQYASGLTGSGIMALGAFAGMATNWFTTNAGKNDYAAKFKKAQGVQNYSVTVNLGGKQYSATLDWLVPTSATFFMGVEFANQLKSGDFDVLDFGGDWAQISTRLFEPVLETSMLSGLYSMLESTRNGYGGDDEVSAVHIMARETVQSYLNSLVPTVLGQAARTSYKSDLQITGDDDWQYWRNQMKSKAGLGETDIFGDALGADTTAYGDVKGEKNTTSDYVKSALKNFISPANIQKVDLDEMDKAKIKQYEDAVKNGADPQEMSYLFPKKQYKKQFQTGNLDVKMSNKDLSAYNQAKATGGAEGARYALESIMFNRYTKDANGNKQSTADAYTPEQKAAIIQQFDGKSIRDVEKWVREQPQFKNSTEAEQKKVIDGLWSYSKQGKSVSAKRVGEQAVIKAQGGDVNEYNFNNEISEKKREVLQPLVDSGVVTYEQAVDFARYAGKTYYYEDDEGGHSQTYYNKGVMYDYLDKMGYDDETKAALFNAFKAWNAKEYGVRSGKGRKGRRRRGYRRYGRGGSSKKTEVPKPKTIKASSFTQGEALVSKRSSSSAKATPPKLKRVQAKIDLPNKKR